MLGMAGSRWRAPCLPRAIALDTYYVTSMFIDRGEGTRMTEQPSGMSQCLELEVRTARTVAETDVYGFAGITGDDHPNHTNEVYAAAQAYGGATIGDRRQNDAAPRLRSEHQREEADRRGVRLDQGLGRAEEDKAPRARQGALRLHLRCRRLQPRQAPKAPGGLNEGEAPWDDPFKPANAGRIPGRRGGVKAGQ